MTEFTRQEREEIEVFKLEYQVSIGKCREMIALKSSLGSAEDLYHYTSPSAPKVDAGKVSSREVNTDKILIAAIQRRDDISEPSRIRIVHLQHQIDALNMDAYLDEMQDWARYLLRRVYAEGASFTQAAKERKDLNYSRNQLQRKLGREILRVKRKIDKK